MSTISNRRSLLAGLAAFVALRASEASAQTGGFEGSWGGAQNGVTAQIIVAGGSVIGFFWRKDYTDAQGVRFSDGGRTLSFTFSGGSAVVRRTGERQGTIDVTEGGKVTRISISKD